MATFTSLESQLKGLCLGAQFLAGRGVELWEMRGPLTNFLLASTRVLPQASFVHAPPREAEFAVLLCREGNMKGRNSRQILGKEAVVCTHGGGQGLTMGWSLNDVYIWTNDAPDFTVSRVTRLCFRSEARASHAARVQADLQALE